MFMQHVSMLYIWLKYCSDRFELSETVSLDSRPPFLGEDRVVKKLLGPHMNRQKQFRKFCRFLGDVYEKYAFALSMITRTPEFRTS